ncbi:MAG TPA: cytidylate kinase-like family protein [Dehalococcoidia bacterium]|nr:cytidylate kinase-like family protein [Dehalococcoidia bacterium]
MTAPVLTFTIQAGTSGDAIAQLVASRLGYAYLDDEVVLRAAQLAGVPATAVAASERWPGLGERIWQGLSSMRREREAAITWHIDEDRTRSLDPRYYRFFLDRVVIQAAHAGNCVIVGHGAQATLRGRGPGICNVLLHGSLGKRASRLASRDSLSEEEARSRLRRKDHEQSEYLKRVYQVDWLAPDLYRLMLNTDDLAEDDAADLIAQVASASDAAPGGFRRSSAYLKVDPRHRTAPSLARA